MHNKKLVFQVFSKGTIYWYEVAFTICDHHYHPLEKIFFGDAVFCLFNGYWNSVSMKQNLPTAFSPFGAMTTPVHILL